MPAEAGIQACFEINRLNARLRRHDGTLPEQLLQYLAYFLNQGLSNNLAVKTGGHLAANFGWSKRTMQVFDNPLYCLLQADSRDAPYLPCGCFFLCIRHRFDNFDSSKGGHLG